MLNPLRDTHAGQPSLRPSARDARPGGAGLIRAATAHRRSRGVAPAADRRRPSRRIASPLQGGRAAAMRAPTPVEIELVLSGLDRSPGGHELKRSRAWRQRSDANIREKLPLRWKLGRQPASDCRRRHFGEGPWNPGRVPPSPQRPATSPAPARPSRRTPRAARRHRPPRSRRARSKADTLSATGARIPGRHRQGRRILRCACRHFERPHAATAAR